MKLLEPLSKKNRVLLLLCPILLLSSCKSKVIAETVYQSPPQAYLTECPQTLFNGTTWGDALDYLLIVQSERDLCASQIDRIREWQAQVK